MVSKVDNLTSVADVLHSMKYVADPDHPNHADVEIGPEHRFRIDPAVSMHDFVIGWERRRDESNARIRRGPKCSRLGIEAFVRAPDGSRITDEEEEPFLQIILTRMNAQAFIRRHRKRKTGATDWHFHLFKKWHRNENPLRMLRRAADEAHADLNEARRLRGGRHIETMVEVKRRRKKEKGCIELAEQLLECGKVTAATLRETVEALGHEVTRFNPAKDTISVHHPGGKKAFRYSISGLFGRMEELRRESAGKASVPVPITGLIPADADIPKTSGDDLDPDL